MKDASAEPASDCLHVGLGGLPRLYAWAVQIADRVRVQRDREKLGTQAASFNAVMI